jgi:hypothetical protein
MSWDLLSFQRTILGCGKVQIRKQTLVYQQIPSLHFIPQKEEPTADHNVEIASLCPSYI